MTTSEIYAHLATLAAQIDASIRNGQTPSNRAHLRHARNQLTTALSAMELVNHTAGIVAQQGAR
jgi:hypothetical protein